MKTLMRCWERKKKKCKASKKLEKLRKAVADHEKMQRDQRVQLNDWIIDHPISQRTLSLISTKMTEEASKGRSGVWIDLRPTLRDAAAGAGGDGQLQVFIDEVLRRRLELDRTAEELYEGRYGELVYSVLKNALTEYFSTVGYSIFSDARDGLEIRWDGKKRSVGGLLYEFN